ncbi:hypothetical protein JL36_08485 [Lactococcus cremoris]|nr:hypothetical protein JL36_08485 [Lactococcus cremoris]
MQEQVPLKASLCSIILFEQKFMKVEPPTIRNTRAGQMQREEPHANGSYRTYEEKNQKYLPIFSR